MSLNLGLARRATDPTSFDLDTATNLYWADAPAIIHQPGRDQQKAELTVRILSGVDRHNPASRILRINFSSEDELLFLHTLEVGEDDFQALKADQGILVDFASFPGKLVSLLQKCISSRKDHQPRFQAILTCHTAETVFKVVETNDFNQLPHITLAFRPGDDAAIKRFLAFRLSEVKAEGTQLLQDLTSTKAEREALREDLKEASHRLSTAQRSAEHTAAQTAAEQQSREAAALKARTEEVAAVREHAEREREVAQQRHAEAVQSLTMRLETLDADNRALRDAKASLEARASELACRLGVAEGAARASEDEAAHLRGVASTAARERADRDAEASDLRARLRLADDKAQGQQQVMREQAERIKGLEATVRHMEERCGELKAALTGQEARTREVTDESTQKGHALDKVTEELKAAREKLRRKADVIGRLEGEAREQGAALEQAAHEGRALSHAHARLQSDLSDLQEERQQLKRKLEDSKQQLQGNEHMIRWLNTQVNEAQMQLGSMSVSSRYTYPRPSQLAPKTPGLSPAPPPPFRASTIPGSLIKASAPANEAEARSAKPPAFDAPTTGHRKDSLADSITTQAYAASGPAFSPRLPVAAVPPAAPGLPAF